LLSLSGTRWLQYAVGVVRRVAGEHARIGRRGTSVAAGDLPERLGLSRGFAYRKAPPRCIFGAFLVQNPGWSEGSYRALPECPVARIVLWPAMAPHRIGRSLNRAGTPAAIFR